jgi:hypothetical protein
VVEPKEGYYYYARQPGGEDFEVIFGTDLTREDFNDYPQPAAETGELEFITEEVDDTIILFVLNGTTKDQVISMKMELKISSPPRG